MYISDGIIRAGCKDDKFILALEFIKKSLTYKGFCHQADEIGILFWDRFGIIRTPGAWDYTSAGMQNFPEHWTLVSSFGADVDNYSLPMPVLTFADEHDLAGKKIVLFCSHGPGGLTGSIRDITAELPDDCRRSSFEVWQYIFENKYVLLYLRPEILYNKINLNLQRYRRER